MASEAAIITAYRQGIAVSAIARRTGKPLGAIEWTLKKAGLKRNDHKRPGVAEAGDATPEDQSAVLSPAGPCLLPRHGARHRLGAGKSAADRRAQGHEAA
jgi:hypothetical protein